MPPHECSEVKRFEKIELVTDGAVKQLAEIKLSLGRIETLLSERILKYDDHIVKGEKFRNDMANTSLGIVVTLILAVVAGAMGYGTLISKADIGYAHAMDKKL